MHRHMVIAVLVLAALYTLTTGALLWRQTDEVVPGVWRTPIPFVCSLVHYTPASVQPFRTVTQDCPGVDSIRVWPLPPVWPWYEDWYEQPDDPHAVHDECAGARCLGTAYSPRRRSL